LTAQKRRYSAPDHWDKEITGKGFEQSLMGYIAAARAMTDEFGQQNQLMGRAMIRCHDCSAEHCACRAR
jgi:hypothetical protein